MPVRAWGLQAGKLWLFEASPQIDCSIKFEKIDKSESAASILTGLC